MIELLYLLPVLASPYFLGAIAADVQWIESGELDHTPAGVLKRKADDMAAHAVEYGFPFEPWHQLAAYWDRVADYTGVESTRVEREVDAACKRVDELLGPDVARGHEPGPAFDLESFVERTKRQYFDEVTKNTGWERNSDKTWTAPSGRRYYPDSLTALTTHERLAGEYARIERAKPHDLNVTWQLKGTDEDLHVFRALQRHGVQVSHDEREQTAHLRGTAAEIQAAKADYDAGFARRHPGGGPNKISVKRRRMGI